LPKKLHCDVIQHQHQSHPFYVPVVLSIETDKKIVHNHDREGTSKMAEESTAAARSSEEGSTRGGPRPRLTRSGTLAYLRQREHRRVRDPLPERLLKYLGIRPKQTPMQLKTPRSREEKST
jgi:hypothetical protein